jgi:tRNA pseudouridine13 synthase
MPREAGPLERRMGMRYYVSRSDGTGGRLRAAPEDFRVTELERFGADVRPPDADPGSYPHTVFRATLRGWDTNDFADALSRKLGISRERVSWAGTKDKHAVSTQLFSVRGVDPGELPAVRDADVEVLGRAGRPVLFGDLAGNAFEIRVREVDHPERAEEVARELRAFAGGDPGDPAAAGVPNFFGHQRFGSLRPITHRAGLEIVRGDWEAAVLEYVTTTSEREPADTREAREYVAETRDWAAATERLPGKLRYERAMCHALAGAGNEPGPEDFRVALETLPANLQRLLVNAAQSSVFNEILCRRLERGLPFHEAVEGDVVCFADRDPPEGLALPDTDRLQRAGGDRLRTVNRHCARGRAFVTAPLVGTETEFAADEPGDIAREVLEEFGVAREDFDLPGEFHSTGTRRAVLVRTGLDVGVDPLVLSFSLPKGSYATVVLREIMKVDPAALT